MNLYADDTLLYRVITLPDDYIKLQGDINTLARWVDDNNLTLNTNKINVNLKIKIKSYSVPANDVIRSAYITTES